MNSSLDYKVSFGKIARTILYEDFEGVIRFTFDASPSKESSERRWTMILERPPGRFRQIDEIEDEHLRTVEQRQLELAFERVRQYLVACGYQVKILPEEPEKAK